MPWCRTALAAALLLAGCFDLDRAAPDAPPDAATDARRPDSSDLDAVTEGCAAHCDCEQGRFCHRGKCVVDPKTPVYCCDRAGCPPGEWCYTPAGARQRCAEDPTISCQTACGCGPGHCCITDPSGKHGVCVKDTADPWIPGGTAVDGLKCDVGADATYCCESAECHAGRLAYGDQADLFRCFDAATNQTVTSCSRRSCLGTACDCEPGEVCVDMMTRPDPPPGSTCNWGAGGTCVSWAVAEALFGWQSSDLLPCCAEGCEVGSACDVGRQRLGSEFAYQRVVGSCGPCADGKHHSCGKCGNGTCDPGEYPGLCPADCYCGDGQCAPEEAGVCAADCGSCGDNKCDPGEPESCPGDCETCGDGWCSASEAGTCGQDCWGPCHDVSTYPGWYRVCGDGFCSFEWFECPRDCDEAVPGTWASIPKGEFKMGSPESEPCRRDDEDRHTVSLTRAFELQTTEVTQGQFEAALGYNPAWFKDCGPDCPVETVTWHEAAAYCNALSRFAGLAECYSCTGSNKVTCTESGAYLWQDFYRCPGYRLPTEAEWEYAYRAGTTTAYHGGDSDPAACVCELDANLDAIGWYCGNASSSAHPVGSKDPNDWGLHDMAGNVSEWCNDWHQERLGTSSASNPVGAPPGLNRVYRGGSWYSRADHARASYRARQFPTFRFFSLGFRCARTLLP